MAQQNVNYSFEEAGSTERTNNQAENVLKIFRNKLGIDNTVNFSDDQQDVLIRYVKSVHLNIEWYTQSKDKQLFQVRLYLLLSFILLLLIPLIVFIVGLFIGKSFEGLSAETILAMITGFITAILAFQQAVGAILRGQIRVKEFWEALSGLKKLLFGLQDRWKGKAVVGKTVSEEFIEEIKIDIVKAEAISQKEQDSFFTNYTVQDVNIGTLLSNAKTTASSMIDKLQSYELTQKYAAEKKALEEKNTAEINGLKAKNDSGQAALKKELQVKELKQAIKTQEEIAKLYEKRISDLTKENTPEALVNLAAARLKFHAAVDATLAAEAQLKVLESTK